MELEICQRRIKTKVHKMKLLVVEYDWNILIDAFDREDKVT
jgi:hypothetical protein